MKRTIASIHINSWADSSREEFNALFSTTQKKTYTTRVSEKLNPHAFLDHGDGRDDMYVDSLLKSENILKNAESLLGSNFGQDPGFLHKREVVSKTDHDLEDILQKSSGSRESLASPGHDQGTPKQGTPKSASALLIAKFAREKQAAGYSPGFLANSPEKKGPEQLFEKEFAQKDTEPPKRTAEEKVLPKIPETFLGAVAMLKEKLNLHVARYGTDGNSLVAKILPAGHQQVATTAQPAATTVAPVHLTPHRYIPVVESDEEWHKVNKLVG